MNNTIEIKDICKEYRGMRLLKNINLKIETGMVYGLIGSDNSRKSLLIKILSGLIRPTTGEIYYFDTKIKNGKTKHLTNIGILVDEIDFYDELTGLENIKLYIKPYIKRLLNVDSEDNISIDQRIDKWFKIFNLFSDKDVKVRKYSVGMKQKLRLIRVFIIEPKIIILDCPTKSLDPIVTKTLRDKIYEYSSKKNVTVFIATSKLSFIDGLADEIGLLNHGEIIDEITKKELEINKRAYFQISTTNLPRLVMTLEMKLKIFNYEVVSDDTVRILEKFEDSSKIISCLVNENIIINEAIFGSFSLESYFLNQIGE